MSSTNRPAAPPLRILLIEDSPIDAELAERELIKHGLTVECMRVSTEKMLRDALRDFQPAVILSDHSMPTFDGLSALRVAREVAPDVPFLYLSGTIGEEKAIEALKGGATDYVLKTNLNRLGPAVERATRDAQERQARRKLEVARSRLAAILEATPDFVGIYNDAGTFSYVNAGGHQLLGLSDTGTHTLRTICAPSLCQRVEEATQEAAASGTWSGEAALVDAQGTEIPVSLVLIAHPIAYGESAGFFSMVARDIRERKHYETHIAYLANHDQLTGLPNRTLLDDRATQAMAHASRECCDVGLVLLSVNDLREINAGYGRNVSDELLMEIARRLAAVCCEGDTVARIANDSFALLFTDIARTEDVLDRARKAAAAVESPMSLRGTTLRVTANIGISLYPRDAEDLERLMANADSALRRARAEGQGNIRFYAAGMERQAVEKLEVQSALEHAMQRNELAMHYQPQFDLTTRQIIGAEALMRWERGNQGSVSPATFVPVAEDSGLIIPLGQWALETACAEAAKWADERLHLAVNVSARQLYQDLAGGVRRALLKSGLPPHRLEIELTESAALRDTGEADRVLRELKRIGVSIAIDDFGTGQCGLSYLSRLPVNRLKIDQSFVQRMMLDPSDRVIVRTITTMARSLNLQVIAEGVETEDQCRALVEDDCQYAQGFVFSKAVSATDFQRLLENASS
jgi:diguanylate cyclase (GGDEF)-like protein/PAS domain S-box-containing protein